MAEGSMPDLGSIMDVLRKNPDAVSGILGILQNAGKTSEKPTEAEYTEKESENTVPVMKDPDKEERHQDDTEKGERHRTEAFFSPKQEERNTERLLDALRPFLSPEKCKRLDDLRRYIGLIRIFQSQGGKM